MTTNSYKKIAQSLVASGAGTLIYTVPAATMAIIKTMTVVNQSGGTATIAVYISGSSAVNCFLPDTPLGDDEHGEWTGSLALEAGATIRVISDTNNALAYHIYGDEVT